LSDGTTRTFFKPDRNSYWTEKAQSWGKSRSDMTAEERRALMRQIGRALRGAGDEE
jgi:hypothetical protein